MALIAMTLGFAANAYNQPSDLYFYLSNQSSTKFDKSGAVYTYTVDATGADVYGVIVNYNAANWDDAHGNNAYFPSGKSGDITVDKAQTWTGMSEWTGTANNRWNSGCLKFAKGKKYDIKMVYANDTFNGTITINGESSDIEDNTAEFVIGKDYYIDASACSWFFDANAIIKVNDGATDVEATVVSGKILKFVPTATGSNGFMTINRINPKQTTEVWNSYTLAAPTGDNNMFAINNSFTGGTWKTFAKPNAWIISQNVNGWTADAISEYKFDEAEGIYTVTVPADMLRSDLEGKDGFKIGYGDLNNWDGYYGSPIDKTLATGVETSAAAPADNNFKIPATATGDIALTFNPAAGKLTATWTVNEEEDPDIRPEDSVDRLEISIPTMDINGEIVVEVTLKNESGKEYCAANWDIAVPVGFEVKDLVLNTDRCTNHEITTNVKDGVLKCVVYSNQNTPFLNFDRPLFTFKLKADNVAVGEASGMISNIIFSTAPTDGNLQVGSRFADTPINITTAIAVKTITATPSEIALEIGDTQAVEVTVAPEDATNKEVEWTIVKGENLISLEDGVITATGSGIAQIEIVAKDGFGAKAIVNVTVGGKPVSEITISEEEHTMYIGEDFTLTAVATPDDATNKEIVWLSSDDNVATVVDGYVKGMGAGVATITALAADGSGVKATCVVTVNAKVSGDADGDDQLTIADIVMIAQNIVGMDVEGIHIENIDMDGDNIITSADIAIAVYFLMNQAASVPEQAMMSNNMLRVTTPVYLKDNTYNVPIYLDAAKNSVAGLQFDVVLPKGLTLTEDSYVAAEASNGHRLQVKDLGDNAYRVVVYSSDNFASNAIGYLTVQGADAVEGNVDIDLNNVVYTNGKTTHYTNDARYTVNMTTGVEMILADGETADVYNTAGVLVLEKGSKTSAASLPAGVYVAKGKKFVVK